MGVAEQPLSNNTNTTMLDAQNAALQRQLDLQKQKEAMAPKRPEYQSALGEDGLLQDKYKMKWAGDINPDMRGMEAFREKALATGPSAWASEALNKQKLEEQGMRDSTQAQGASAAAGARSAMASKFGLSPAAAARLATQQMRAQMTGMQNVGMSGAKARADIGMQDESTKNQFLQALPGQENNLAQIGLQNRTMSQDVDKMNLQNTFNQKAAGEENAMTKYQEQMKQQAADKNAEAMRSQSGGK